MIEILFLIIPFICGYLFSSRFIYTRIKIANSSGHKLHALSLAIGFFLVFIYASIFNMFPSDCYYFSSKFYYFWPNLKSRFIIDTQNSVSYKYDNIILFSLISIIISPLFAKVLNIYILNIIKNSAKLHFEIDGVLETISLELKNKGEELSKTDIDNLKIDLKKVKEKFRYISFFKVFLLNWYESLFEVEYFEKLFYEASITNKPVMVTLESGKVYIGNVQSALDFEATRKEIEILPWFSGFRESESKDLHLITNYLNYYMDFYASSDSKNCKVDNLTEYASNSFMIVIDFSKIISASLFDWEAFIERFNKKFEFENIHKNKKIVKK